MRNPNDGLVLVYVLTPITVLLAIIVITYMVIKQRQLAKRMIESGKSIIDQLFNNFLLLVMLSGQLVPVMPAVVAYQQQPLAPQQELRSPTTGKNYLFKQICS